MIAVWLALLLASVVGASMASRQAVTAALRVTDAVGVSPAVVGFTVMAVGTDLPEIANSLVSAGSGHGDVNVGDSMGSVFTQVTLVLGLLCLASGPIRTDRSFVARVGGATVAASVLVWVLVGDSDLSHADGLLLVSAWIVGTVLLGQDASSSPSLPPGKRLQITAAVALTLLWLGAVGAFAVGVVQSFLALADAFGVPEFVGAFIVLSIGTSLPELVVDSTAIRRGAPSMAIGDVFGSSFVDATLSIGIGPLVFGSQLSANVGRGVAIAALGVLLATALVAGTGHHGRALGVRLVVLYLLAQAGVAFFGG